MTLERLTAALADRYRIERRLGEGGMATVYLAHDLRHDRQVAVKVLRSELAAALGAERFLREIKIAANLQHPHILPVHDSGEAGNLLYYVMPYVEGQSLRQKLQREGALPIPEAVRILHDLADALAYAHQHGVVHRDIKPENVMLSGRHALVTDFGVAKAVSQATGQSNMTTAGIALGTPAYMAPEQAMADPGTDHRADIYAFGVLAYELLTGQPPFTGTTPQAIVAAHLTTAAEPIATRRAEIPPALAALVMRCLAKQPGDRWQSAEELLPILDAARTPSAGMTPAGTMATPAIRRRNRAAAGIGLGLIAVVVVVLAARRAGGPTVRPSDGPTASEPESIAVLPLVNVGGDSTQEFFADGMTEELATALGKVRGLRVAARTSSYAFKGRRDLDLREVAEKLHVGVVLEGSVRRVGDRMKVSVQLIDAVQQVELWSETYDQAVKDAFAVQDSITRAIVRQLALTLGGTELAASVAGRTTNPEAHDLYLQGQALFHQSTEQALRRALDYYRQALAKDPEYAQAWQGMAWTYAFLADVYQLPSVAYDSAKLAARRALDRDSLVAEAYAVLGYASYATDMNLTNASRVFRRGIELSPNSADAHGIYGNWLCFAGPIDQGLAEIDRAIELDRLAPLVSFMREWCLYLARRYDEVLAQHDRTRALDSTFFYGDWFAAAALREQGKYEDALAEYRRAQAVAGDWPFHGLALTYARMGRVKEARAVLAQLEAYARKAYVNPLFFAEIHASLGEKDLAFEWLERAATDRTVWMAGLNRWPELDPLRSDPRFAAMVKRLGAPLGGNP